MVLVSPVTLAQSAAHREPPAFSIDNKQYRLKDLTGFSQSELRAKFDAEVAGLGTDDIVRKLRSRGPAYSADAAASRPQLQAALWKYAISNLLDAVAGDLVLAAVYDRVVQEHQIEVAEYFDLAPLRDGIERQLGYLDFVYQHQHDAPGGEDKLHTEAVQRFRFRMDRDYWTATGPEFRARPAFLKWTLLPLHQAPKNDDYLAKSLLAHYLVRQACEEGVYYRKAKQVFDWKMPPPQLLEIKGYRGSRHSLELILPQIVDANGSFNGRAAQHLATWLKELAPGATAHITAALSSGSAELNIPAPGTLYEVAPGTYHVYARAGQQTATDTTANGLNLFYKNYAYRLAAKDLMPVVHSHLRDWEPDMERFGQLLSLPVTNRMPEVAFDNFVKKPYSDTVFEEFEQHRAQLHDLAVSAARTSSSQDRESLAVLLATLAEKTQTAKTPAVRQAYQAIGQRLLARVAVPAASANAP